MRECCRNDANLRVVESTATHTIRRCAVCGARHFELEVKPGNLLSKPPAPKAK